MGAGLGPFLGPRFWLHYIKSQFDKQKSSNTIEICKKWSELRSTVTTFLFGGVCGLPDPSVPNVATQELLSKQTKSARCARLLIIVWFSITDKTMIDLVGHWENQIKPFRPIRPPMKTVFERGNDNFSVCKLLNVDKFDMTVQIFVNQIRNSQVQKNAWLLVMLTSLFIQLCAAPPPTARPCHHQVKP